MSDTVTPPDPAACAEFGPRAGARLIDLVLSQVAALVGGIFAGVALVVLATLKLAPEGWMNDPPENFLLNFVVSQTANALATGACTAICGTTPGKLLLGLRVATEAGQRPSFFQVVVRELGFMFDGLFFGLVGKGAMDGSPLRQRHADRWAHTVVVQKQGLSASTLASNGRLAFGCLVGAVLYATVTGVAEFVAVIVH